MQNTVLGDKNIVVGSNNRIYSSSFGNSIANDPYIEARIKQLGNIDYT